MAYEVIPTALSLIAAIVISGIALYLAGRQGRFTVGGWMADSVLAGLVAATAALWLAFNLDRMSHQLVAAFVMGVAVCAMHYTGMSAVTLICTAKAEPGTWLVANSYLDIVVFATASLALVHIYRVLSGRTVRVRRSETRRSAARRVPVRY